MSRFVRTQAVEIDVTALHMTEHALLVTSDGKNQAWLRFSEVEIRHRGKPNLYTLTMYRALAKEKGLI